MTTQATTPVAVITGTSSGIGKEAAKLLVDRGWKVIGLGRNPERCEQAKAEILERAADGDQVAMINVDLALLSDAERAAREIAALTDRVDVLLNNAGGVTKDLQITAEGNENTFASNHLGHFLLTKKLLPLLHRSAASSAKGSTRVINVSSLAHEYCDGLDWNDLQTMDNYESNTAYCRAKFANILFTRELAKRVANDGIVVHAMHPGMVSSNFVNHAGDMMQSHFESKKDEAVAPEIAADTLVWLSSAEEPGLTTGDYFYQRSSIPTSAAGQDDAAADRLWQESEKLVAKSLA